MRDETERRSVSSPKCEYRCDQDGESGSLGIDWWEVELELDGFHGLTQIRNLRKSPKRIRVRSVKSAFYCPRVLFLFPILPVIRVDLALELRSQAEIQQQADLDF